VVAIAFQWHFLKTSKEGRNTNDFYLQTSQTHAYEDILDK